MQNIDRGQRTGCNRGKCELIIGLQNDQRDPGMKPVAIGRRGREEPGKVGRVEFDSAEIIRLEVNGELAWLGADHHARIDARHIARPEHLHVTGGAADGIRRRSTLHLQGQLHVQIGAGSAELPLSTLLALAPMPRRAQARK